MSQDSSDRITERLTEFRSGQHDDAELMALVYAELHRLAVRYMRTERSSHTLQPTALVHEAYLRLASQRSKAWKNRSHFFAVAALLMRQILVDSARNRSAVKRGHDRPHVRIESADRLLPYSTLTPVQAEDLIVLDDALTALAQLRPRQSRIVELRFFAGMTTREIAEALDMSARTVEREWAAAQAWLYARLRPSE
jgi:RNA polymerase sigma-70 factor, ECF subfamily